MTEVTHALQLEGPVAWIPEQRPTSLYAPQALLDPEDSVRMRMREQALAE